MNLKKNPVWVYYVTFLSGDSVVIFNLLSMALVFGRTTHRESLKKAEVTNNG